jgi:hypothetical protein
VWGGIILLDPRAPHRHFLPETFFRQPLIDTFAGDLKAPVF